MGHWKIMGHLRWEQQVVSSSKFWPQDHRRLQFYSRLQSVNKNDDGVQELPMFTKNYFAECFLALWQYDDDGHRLDLLQSIVFFYCLDGFWMKSFAKKYAFKSQLSVFNIALIFTNFLTLSFGWLWKWPWGQMVCPPAPTDVCDSFDVWPCANFAPTATFTAHIHHCGVVSM